MSESREDPTCPRCGAAMVQRQRGSDGSPFWGCSTFPKCRGTRELATVTNRGHQPTATFGVSPGRDRGRGPHFDRVVLVCGAVGLVIGLGFIVSGLNSRPNTYVFIGAILVVLMAVVVLPSPFLPTAFVRGYALRVALLCVCLAVFFIAWMPVSTWVGHLFVNQMLQAIPTPTATPSTTP